MSCILFIEKLHVRIMLYLNPKNAIFILWRCLSIIIRK